MTKDQTPGKLDDRIEAIAHVAIGAAIEVHRTLGPGFLEAVYENAMCVELTQRGIPFVRQRPVTVTYKGVPVGDARIDLLVEDQLILELKSVEVLAPVHTAQLLSYLRSLNLRLGLLINFNVPILKDGLKRLIN